MEWIIGAIIAVISGAWALANLYKNDNKEKELRISNLESRVSVLEEKVDGVELDISEIKELRSDIKGIQKDIAIISTLLHERTNKGA